MDRFNQQDYEANKGKYQLFSTARINGHVFTENGGNDIPADTVVGIKYRCDAFNALRRKHEPVYTVTLQDGSVWGDMYGNNLYGFVL